MTDTTTRAPTREELIAQLDWNEGGTGFGLCTFGNSMIWRSQRPKHPRGADDLKGIVAVSLPKEKYTDEELLKLVEFNKRITADYDKYCGYRLGANLICIDKTEFGNWLRKKMSWEYGPMFSPTLDEAIKFMERRD